MDLKLEINDIALDEIQDIVDSVTLAHGNNVKVTINRPWPKMKLGDEFTFDDTEYVFIAYISSYKAKGIAKKELFGSSVVQAVYFDCSKMQPGRIKFKDPNKYC